MTCTVQVNAVKYRMVVHKVLFHILNLKSSIEMLRKIYQALFQTNSLAALKLEFALKDGPSSQTNILNS